MWGSTPELMGGGRCRMLRLRGVRSAVGLGIGAGVEGRRCCPLASAGMGAACQRAAFRSVLSLRKPVNSKVSFVR